MQMGRKGKKGLSLRFGLDDFTKEDQDELLRKEIVRLLADRKVSMEELAWRCRKIYVEAGSPEGPGAEGFVRWLEKI